MSRYTMLEKEINKGIKIDEKSNQLINNWSPNNVRRLIIGSQHAIVQYHVTGVKYRHQIEVVSYGNMLNQDIEQLRNDPKKYVPLIKVLTAGRICSSIEEILFCSTSYPQDLLKLDMDVWSITPNNGGDVLTRLTNRFVRLHKISVVPCGVKDVASLLEVKAGTNPALAKLTIPNEKVLYSMHQDDWFKGTALRSHKYSMDRADGALAKHFATFKESVDSLDRQSKLDEIDFEKDKEILQREYSAINVLCARIMENVEKANAVFDGVNLFDKTVWAGCLYYKNMGKGIRQELFYPCSKPNRSDEELVKDNLVQKRLSTVKRIDTEKIVSYLKRMSLNTKNIEGFMGFIFESVLIEIPNTREKSDISTSLKSLRTLLVAILNMQMNISYTALVDYLSQSSVKYADHYAFNLDLTELVYTRPIVEYMNKTLTNRDVKACLNRAGIREVLVDGFEIAAKLMVTNKILTELSKIA